MNELQIFNNEEFGDIRTVEVDGKPYFVGIDIARALGYSNPSKAIIQHCKGVTKLGIPSKGAGIVWNQREQVVYFKICEFCRESTVL